ncbi:nuclear receptor subfamily 1 group D member 2-like [Ruditapes philippinarum]|uniref:nuclear receptor subfamily 1 group D member 2-like n=1 Tax=Ruditapes philippinarum TaxID=129788 RepID=UPI00295B1EEC|nr:nuclear receptor subfamily 1 group D member 2-like [Ruditapes philippinarum]XP_060592889.1 nuclear receptor subfamily 1 group D member 2-like [Ruditapes philippinarum]
MHTDGSDVGETGFQLFRPFPAFNEDYTEEMPSTSLLSPLLLSSCTQINDDLNEWHDISSTTTIDNGAYSIPTYSPQVTLQADDDYVITSLDGYSVASNDNSGYTSSGISSPEALSSSYSPTESPETVTDGISVTSRLKCVLMSRQKKQNNLSASVPNEHSTPSSAIHNYSSAERRVVDNKFSDEAGKYEKCTSKTALRFPPCSVCGGTASGLHYGVNSCEPCKGFFTRYLRKKEVYKCAKDNNCPITNRLRGNCSACRLKKCLALGMARKNSRLGRYSLSRRMETIMQVNELEKQNDDQVNQTLMQDFNGKHMNEMPIIDTDIESRNSGKIQTDHQEQAEPVRNTHSASFKLKAPSGFSYKLVKTLVEYMERIKPYGEDITSKEQIMQTLLSHYESYKLKIDIFGNLRSVPRDEYFNLLKGFGIEIDKRMMFLKQSANEMMDIIERYCNFAKQIPNFTCLSNRDQTNLLKSSRYDFFMILMHDGYLHEKQVFLAHNGAAFHMEEVADKFFSRKLVINVCDMYHRLQKLKLSKEENALLIAISLVFTDRCSLENPSLVEQIQFSLTQLLQKQLQRTCPSSALRRFTKIIDCLTIMRESSELYLKEYSELCQDEMVIEEVPIMTELLFED